MPQSFFPIEQHKQPDGWYRYDGCDYQDAAELLRSRILVCGCGMPEAAMLFVVEMLECFSDLGSAKTRAEMDAWCEQRRATEARLMQSDGARYFVYYLLNELGLLEHGGSVPGWPTEEGKAFVAAARANIEPET